MSGVLSFIKAHGLGNDFLLVAADQAPDGTAPAGPAGSLAEWARRLCDRHTGVGADGVVLYRVASRARAHMRLVNADGGEAEISGNGLRCLSASLVRAGHLAPRHAIQTAAGPRAVEVAPTDATRFRVTCGLGTPILASADIPVRLDPPRTPVIDHAVDVGGRVLRVTATSLGNPHCALFLDAPPDDATLADLGPRLERHPDFPRRTNVEFVTVITRAELRVRFWERGVGTTRASGTGAGSAAVAAVLTGRCDRSVQVVCDGGTLAVEWPEDGPVQQTGDVEVLFSGDWPAR